MSGLEFIYLESVAYEDLSNELSEHEEDADLFIKRFEELEQSLIMFLSESWKFDCSGLNGDFFLDSNFMHGCELSVGLTSERIMKRTFLESLVEFLEQERCDWLIDLKWPNFDGSCEGLGGRAFVQKNKVYFDLEYPKESYDSFRKTNS